MRPIILLILAVTAIIPVYAQKFSYRFNDTPISEALVKICREHKDLNVAFIYKELDHYRTSARISSDNPYEAIRTIIGQNPISVVEHKGNFYVEALQRGKYRYSGKVTGTDGQPVVAATVLLMNPKDSVVVTYGTTDAAGNFSIPCDSRQVIGKISSIGYSPKILQFNNFSLGTIIMTEEAIALKELNVRAEDTYLYADRSVYIPTTRQKNASQTATELLNRMAIPQLALSNDKNITTVSGAGVAIYIDYLSASEEDITGLRTTDVKRVEYYDYPQDPRFKGAAHVVNFIMQQYEYGGYAKAYGEYNLFGGSGELPLFSKVKYKKMTYDLGVGWSQSDSKHDYSETKEIYRLPQPEGGERIIERRSSVDEARNTNRTNWSTLRATYISGATTIRNSIGVNFDHSPHQDWSGKMDYTPRSFSSDFSQRGDERVNSFSYKGEWNYSADAKNTFSFQPTYVYSHTNNMSDFTQTDAGSYLNMAKDNTHQFLGVANYSHSFGNAGTINAMFQSRITSNRTIYEGTSDYKDSADTYRLGPGVTYYFRRSKIYTQAGVGFMWDKVIYQDLKDCQIAPWVDFFFQFIPTQKHSVSLEFHHAVWTPSSSYRSANILKINPLMSYTGYPGLAPYKSFDQYLSYIFRPVNNVTISANAGGWLVTNPYAFDYQASPEEILRTVIQPAGVFSNWNFSIRASVRLLANSLILSGQLGENLVHHGYPYDLSKASLYLVLTGQWYYENWNFGAYYASGSGRSTNFMEAAYVRSKDSYNISIGWSNSKWNLQASVSNFFRWNWRGSRTTMNSRNYDYERQDFTTSAHCGVKLSATYTFGFGRKVERGNEVSQTYGVNSGILK